MLVLYQAGLFIKLANNICESQKLVTDTSCWLYYYCSLFTFLLLNLRLILADDLNWSVMTKIFMMISWPSLTSHPHLDADQAAEVMIVTKNSHDHSSLLIINTCDDLSDTTTTKLPRWGLDNKSRTNNTSQHKYSWQLQSQQLRVIIIIVWHLTIFASWTRLTNSLLSELRTFSFTTSISWVKQGISTLLRCHILVHNTSFLCYSCP